MRGTSLGYGIPGGTQTGSTTVNGYSVPQDLTLSGNRSGVQPAEYVAANNVEFTGEFESASSDEFSAYIADASYAGTGNQANGGAGSNLAGGYRYGFNGKENDADVKGDGNEIDYGMRIYDPRIGKFLSVDPLQKKYPELTPYQFASNSPIDGIDKDGLEWEAAIFHEIFVRPFIDFREGTKDYARGTVRKVVTQTGNASYQNANVPQHVQERLATVDVVEGTTKQITGGTKMFVATADVVSTYVPLATEATLAERTVTKAPAAGRWITKAANELPKPASYANWGAEFLDDAIRMTEQSFVKSEKTVLDFGKNAKGHLIKHADVLGFGGKTPQELQKMVPQLEKAAKDLFAKMKLERVGEWNGTKGAKFFIGEGKMIVTEHDGTLITTINKTSNAWFQKATPIK